MVHEYGFFETADEVIRFYTIFFGTLALCATILVFLADWQERNRVLWGFLGLIFGPFAFVLFFFWGRKKRKALKENALPEKKQSETAQD